MSIIHLSPIFLDRGAGLVAPAAVVGGGAFFMRRRRMEDVMRLTLAFLLMLL